jgi:hypothetical protein
VEIPEQRPPVGAVARDAIQIRVEGVSQLAGTAGRIERIGRTVQDRPMLQNEVVPRRFASERTRTREREIGDVQS